MIPRPPNSSDSHSFMKASREFFTQDSFASLIDVELVDVRPGWAKTRLEITEQHLNSLGTGHGAAIFALADVALEIACNTYEDSLALGLQVNTSYISAVKPGDVLYAETEELSLKNRIGNYTATVTDEAGTLIASVQCTVYRKKAE